jgi:predicted transcriptional regulator
MKRAFGDLEHTILSLLQGGERKTVKEIHAELGGNDKYITIMTVMNRLVEKKRLVREKNGLQYIYWLSSENEIPSLIQQFKNKFFGLRTPKLVSHLIESTSDFTEDEIEELEKIIKKAKLKNKNK